LPDNPRAFTPDELSSLYSCPGAKKCVVLLKKTEKILHLLDFMIEIMLQAS
jgi:hypothetical protein